MYQVNNCKKNHPRSWYKVTRVIIVKVPAKKRSTYELWEIIEVARVMHNSASLKSKKGQHWLEKCSTMHGEIKIIFSLIFIICAGHAFFITTFEKSWKKDIPPFTHFWLVIPKSGTMPGYAWFKKIRYNKKSQCIKQTYVLYFSWPWKIPVPQPPV